MSEQIANPPASSSAADNPGALLQAHHQTFNYLICCYRCSIAATVAASTATRPIWLLLPTGAILLPLVTGPLALILFDHEIVLNAINSYILKEGRGISQVFEEVQ